MTANDWAVYGQWLAVAIILVTCVCVIYHRVSEIPDDDDDSDQYGC